MSRIQVFVSAAVFAFIGSLVGAMPVHALLFDQNIVAIFGSGNADTNWTVDRDGGVEVGLRAKVRYDTVTNGPLNVFNSNGDGTYNHAVGAPPAPATRARWNFEWSVNTDYLGTSGDVLTDYTYLLEMDFDPGAGTTFAGFDPINIPAADHSIGNNSTLNGQGLEAPGDGVYATLIAGNNIAQQSWNLDFFDEFFSQTFDPTLDGTYDFRFSVFDLQRTPVASTWIQVIVGAGASIPEPASLSLMGIGLAGLLGLRRRKRL